MITEKLLLENSFRKLNELGDYLLETDEYCILVCIYKNETVIDITNKKSGMFIRYGKENITISEFKLLAFLVNLS